MIVKNGHEPTVVHRSGQSTAYAVSATSDVIDTTGAGDAFAAGYLVKRALGAGNERAAVESAHRLAARTLTSHGATPI